MILCKFAFLESGKHICSNPSAPSLCNDGGSCPCPSPMTECFYFIPEKILKLYFAHNFNDRFKFREIELQLEKELGIELYNPFYDDPSRKEEMAELDSIAQKAEDRIKSFENSFNRKQESAELIVKRDLTAIASCDGLFTIVESPSFGTTIEICNATLMKKPIYFVSEKYINHPWIKVYATYKFKTLEDFKQQIREQGNEF